MHFKNVPLAIVGMACRFPGGVKNVASFWKLLIQKRSGIVEIPPDRWDWRKYYHPNPEVPGHMVTKWGGFIDDYDYFDPSFFGISPREANQMDPQQRWLLETSWEAFEDAGLPPQGLKDSQVGVFVGIASHDYADVQRNETEASDAHTGTGSALSIAANRLSYFYDFQGPSVAVDTACSSSLTAVYLACQSIWGGDASLAVVGGTNNLLNPSVYISFSKASMLSPDGRCFTFDHRANGYVRGEGVGVVIIKPLADAQADNDRVYAVIRSAVANQDGRSSSLTVPSQVSQEEMLRQAYRDAGIDPNQISYIETHGTGTPVGDPLEARALGNVAGQDRKEPCLIGSVKTNIGHLEAAAGMAGLIKGALVLHHQTIPAHLNFERPNPNIPLDELGLKVVCEKTPLPKIDGHSPVVGVNSFGFGGANAHIVLEAAPDQSSEEAIYIKALRPYTLMLSASDEAVLKKQAENYHQYLLRTDENIADITANAGMSRSHHAQRLVVIGKEKQELCARLLDYLNGETNEIGLISGQAGQLYSEPVFVFTGQGSQWWGMSQQLLQREPSFRKIVEAVDEIFQSLSGWSIIDELHCDEEKSRIDDTDVIQPAMLAVQLGLTTLWGEWGIKPAKSVGLSVGEVAAAYVAGIYSLEDAVKIIYHRSRLQHTTAGQGSMAAVGLPAETAQEAIRDLSLEIAAVLSSNMVTLAGLPEDIDIYVDRLKDEDVFVRNLPIQYAFHTAQMEPLKEELLAALTDIQPRSGQIPFISTVTGELTDGKSMDAEYWYQNLRKPVLFEKALNTLIASNDRLFLEIGPHPALQHAIKDALANQGQEGHVFYSIRRNADESRELLNNLAGLHIHNAPIDWQALNQSENRFVELPRYPWNHQSYGKISDVRRRLDLEPFEHPLLGARLPAVQPTWEVRLNPHIDNYLNDHVLWNSIVFPGAGYGEIGLAVARNLFPGEPYAVHQLKITNALFISPTTPPLVRVVFDKADKSFSVFSAINVQDDWQLHVHGHLLKIETAAPNPIEIDTILEGLAFFAGQDEFYKIFENMSISFGPEFRQIDTVWGNGDRSLTKIKVTDRIKRQLERYHFHPVLIDACFQTVATSGMMASPSGDLEISFLPMAVERIRLLSENFHAELWVQTEIRSQTTDSITADFKVYQPNGELLAEILGGRFDRLMESTANTAGYQVYQLHWEQKRLKTVHPAERGKFPPVTEIVHPLLDLHRELYQSYDLQRITNDYFPQLEAIAHKIFHGTLIALGWDYELGSVIACDDLMLELGIIGRHRPLVEVVLEQLEINDLLTAVDDKSWRVIGELVSEDVRVLLDDLLLSFPQMEANITLQKSIADNLKDILRGQLDPMEVLFPNGSSQVLKAIYSNTAHSASYEVVAATLTLAIENLPEDQPLRILEIGSGTGGLTAAILPSLPANRTEYTFSDISPKFLQEARQHFGNFPFVEYRHLDLTRSLVDQGFSANSFDIVLGANVVHAIPNIPRTLDLISECLDENGLFLFIELTGFHMAYTLIFGLLEEWWHFDEEIARFRTNIKTKDQWQELLRQHGYQQVSNYSFQLVDEQLQFYLTTFLAEAPKIEIDSVVDKNADTYLIFADQGGICSTLGHALAQTGGKVIYAKEDFESQLRAEAPTVIVHGLLLDHSPVDDLSVIQLLALQETGVMHALRLIHALEAVPVEPQPQVVFLSRDAQSVNADDRSNMLSATPVKGLLRVARNEHSGYRWRHIDLDGDKLEMDIENIVNEILFPDYEVEIAYRSNKRYLNRLRQIQMDDLPYCRQNAVHADGVIEPYQLEFDTPGQLSNLTLNMTTRPAPGLNEVEVQVKAGGINFRDVMKVLGVHPGVSDDLTWLGDDFAGVIVGVGENVKDFRVGEAVIGICPYAFRTFITVDHRMIFKMPGHLSFTEGATIPSVFATAHYALVKLARLQAGESVLIHAATGGVGQAAIQIAKNLELEIFATASTNEKQAFLRAQGIDQIFNSRTLDFADEIMTVTNSRGVDAVLNSLAGDFIPRNFSILAPFGRYLEIGKVDVYDNTKIGLEAMRNNISLHIIDLAGMLIDRPDAFVSVFSELAEKFKTKTYSPLAHSVLPVTEAVEAFRYMAAGKHIGKNVLSFEVDEIPVGRMTKTGHLFRADSSYLITGGAGGFGLEVAKWMAREGARHLVLMSRSGPPDEQALEDVDVLRANGVKVIDARGDVTKQEDVDQVIGDIQENLLPIAGVFHAAMVLNDHLLIDLDQDGFNRAFHPKILGAWNLHLATLPLRLDHFVCFSSLTSVVGMVKQANYCAGNAFLDDLANYRHARRLPALTVNWGILSGAGFMERNPEMIAYFEKAGGKAIPIDLALQALRYLLLRKVGQVGIASIEWAQLGKHLANVTTSPMFEHLNRLDMGDGTKDNLLAQLESASTGQQQTILVRFVAQSIAGILGASLEAIEYDVPVNNFGLDSLMAIELITVINNQLKINLAASDMLSNATIENISDLILRKILMSPEGQTGAASMTINWDAEATLDAEIFPEVPESASTSSPEKILLTGATGFLGAFILSDLLNHTDAEFYCLIRGAKDPLKRISNNLEQYDLWDDSFLERVIPIPGNLSKPLLGMSEDQFETLANEIDTIFHLAADLNLTLPYEDLKSTNVSGVQEILRLASRGKAKRVHFASTIAVFFGMGQKERVSESDRSSPQNLFSGYAQSKSVAEQLVFQAQKRGIACTIYRLALITGQSQTGMTNRRDLVSCLVKGVYQMGAYSDQNIPINIIPVDYASKALVSLSKQASSAGKVYHLTNPENVETSSLVRWSGDEDYLKEIPYLAWQAILVRHAEQKVENDLIPFLPMFPPTGLEDFEQSFGCQDTLVALAGSGIVCPPIDQAMIEKYRDFLLSANTRAD